jgi:hypothetical protein
MLRHSAVVIALLLSSIAEADIHAVALRCELNVNPLNIDAPNPRLSWQLDSSERDQIQTAYQVLAASDPTLLTPDAADLWNSGRVESRESLQIAYEGKPLASGQAVYWTVRAWDRDADASDWSEPAHFEMALDIVDAQGYAILVPAVDADGNDRAGVRAPMVQAPLGTYTGWNLRCRGRGHGAMNMFDGSYIPFADSEDERTMTGDPRASILERYADTDGYVRAIEKAARALLEDRLMLAEDVERSIAAAADWGRPLHDVKL